MIRIAATALLATLTAGAWAPSTSAQDPLPPAIPPESFGRLHKMLRPTLDELADFWDLPWQVSVHEAREKASTQDKPILAYFGANGSVLGAT